MKIIILNNFKRNFARNYVKRWGKAAGEAATLPKPIAAATAAAVVAPVPKVIFSGSPLVKASPSAVIRSANSLVT